jgi:hypothetical protein
MVSASSTSMLSAQPVLRRIATLLGWLSLFATLALLSPGVVATARADEPVAAGPSCPISRERDERTVEELSRTIEMLRAQLADRDSAGEAEVMNTRGYNYGARATPPQAGSEPPPHQ